MVGHDLSIYKKRISSFGWNTIEIDGHDTYQIISALKLAKTSKKPFAIIAKTFKGISTALTQYQDGLKEVGARIYVRRGGPNYKEGLENMRKLGEEIGIPIEVYGPETHMTRIVRLALEA